MAPLVWACTPSAPLWWAAFAKPDQRAVLTVPSAVQVFRTRFIHMLWVVTADLIFFNIYNGVARDVFSGQQAGGGEAGRLLTRTRVRRV